MNAGRPSDPRQAPLEERRDPGAPVTRADMANMQRQLATGDLRMTAIESELRNNTAITADIRVLLEAARVGLKVLGAIGVAVQWLSKIAAAALAIYAAWQAFIHGGGSK